MNIANALRRLLVACALLAAVGTAVGADDGAASKTLTVNGSVSWLESAEFRRIAP